MPSPPIIILGMHRSGTSCLAGLLEEAGLWLGEVRRASPHNRKGNRENPEIMALNDAVLAANHAAWNAPPGKPPLWHASHFAMLNRIVADYPKDKVWGFKDPRSLLTLEGWRQALPGARLAGTFRHPLAVARSLKARSNMPVEQGLALWSAYNTRLLALVCETGLPLVSFDQPAEHYLGCVTALARDLGLDDLSAGAEFFDPSLRHQTPDTGTAAPPQIQDLHAALLEHAIK